jgi:hypothetical protein
MAKIQSLNLMYLNVTDTISMKEPTYSKVRKEVEFLLSNEVASGRIDITKEHNLFVSTVFGAANVMLIPKVH